MRQIYFNFSLNIYVDNKLFDSFLATRLSLNDLSYEMIINPRGNKKFLINLTLNSIKLWSESYPITTLIYR